MIDTPLSPLSVLASRALGAFTRDYDALGSVPPLPLWSVLLRLAGQTRVERRQVPELARISKRAADAAVANCERRGWVSLETNPAGRSKVIVFSPTGLAAAAAGKAGIGTVEAAWEAAHGSALREARAALERLVSSFELEHPHYPVTYGLADPTFTGWAGPQDPKSPGPERVTPHGKEWHPVQRTDARAVKDMSLPALLAAVIVQYTIDYDSAGTGTLHAAINVLRHHPNLPPVGPGDGPSLLERHGIIAVTTPPSVGAPQVELTALGHAHLAAFAPLVAAIDQRWRNYYGNEAVTDLTGALTALTRTGGDDLPDHVAVGLASWG